MISLVKYIYGRTQSANDDGVVEEKPNELVASVEETIEKPKKPAIEIEIDLPQAKEIEELHKECPDLVLSNHRNVLGIVDSVQDAKLTVNANFKNFIIDMAKVNIECALEVGDHVYVRCYIQTEELFDGAIVETLDPFAIIPSMKKKNIKYMVQGLQTDYVELDNDCFISQTVLKQYEEINLKHGDFIFADVIECNVKNFKWRCVHFTLHTNKELADLVRVPKHRSKGKKAELDRKGSQRLVRPTPVGRWNTYQIRLCEYANQVWSQERGDIISGQSSFNHRRFKAVRIPSYEVPSKIRTTYLTLYDKQALCQKEIETCYPSLREPLNFKNYLGRFQALLWLEEAELFKNFRQYDIERCQFNVESEHLSVTILNLGERRPSLVIGDKVHALPIITETPKKDEENGTKPKPPLFEGIVQGILYDKVLLKFHKIFMENYGGESYRLEFYFSRTSLRRLHYALYHAVETLGEDFLFPRKIQFRDRPQLDYRMELDDGIMRTAGGDIIKWHNPKLNTLQRSAIYNILRGEVSNMPYVIYGPPGTGKTITVIECVLQLVSNLPNSRILVATPSNSAANLVCTRLIESQGLHMGEMVRLVSFNLIERDQVPEELLSYCATVDPGEDGTYEEELYLTKDGLQMNCPKRVLANYRVTIGTCAVLGKYLELGFKTDHFTHVIVDEAGQCTEPSVMIPVSQVAKNHGQVILAGDPMQLQAIVVNKYAEERGLSTSFLERIMNMPPYKKDAFSFEELSGYNPILITKLCQSYRALPSILRIYNYLFYDLELKSTISTIDSPEAQLLKKLEDKVLFPSKTRPPAHGAYFYAVRGENIREADSPSWCNPRQANVVFSTTLALYRAGVKPDDIGIITPYLKQVKLIRSLFMKAKLVDPKIGSVEEFQGQERNIILLSTVRTGKNEVLNYDFRFGLGFVRSERRLNVAISRARALLIVFGDRHLLNSDDCWCIYVGDCQHNDSFFGSEDGNEKKKINGCNERGDDNGDNSDKVPSDPESGNDDIHSATK